MKLTVLSWLGNWIIGKIARVIEVSFRFLLLLLPLGLYLLLIQSRSRVSSFSSLSVYTKAESVWQHVFPGFVLVAIDRDELRNWANTKKSNFQAAIERNKYLLCFLLAATLVGLMTLMYIK